MLNDELLVLLMPPGQSSFQFLAEQDLKWSWQLPWATRPIH